MTPFYLTGEPFLKGEYDLRIQRIGEHVRVMSRHTLSGAWKTNTGSSHLSETTLTTGEVQVTPQFKAWSDAAAQLFGGLDIFALDALGVSLAHVQLTRLATSPSWS